MSPHEISLSREQLIRVAAAGGYPTIDLSLGISAAAVPPLPCVSDGLQHYPPSRGSGEFRRAAADYLRDRWQCRMGDDQVAACGGLKEFIATAPLLLRARAAPFRDTVLIPQLCYPTYQRGAHTSGLRTFRVPTDRSGAMAVAQIPAEVADRALCLWVNSPANPTGRTEPVARIVEWARAHAIPVLVDEAYLPLTWAPAAPRSALSAGLDGVLVAQSVSKGFGYPGLRIGWYAGDAALVDHLVHLRREMGLIPSAGAQRAGAALLRDADRELAHRADVHADLTTLVDVLARHGLRCRLPDGGPFVWCAAPGGDGSAFAAALAEHLGIVVAPGDAYGPAGAGHVRISATGMSGALDKRLAHSRRSLTDLAMPA